MMPGLDRSMIASPGTAHRTGWATGRGCLWGRIVPPRLAKGSASPDSCAWSRLSTYRLVW